jgi:hypothetical protein
MAELQCLTEMLRHDPLRRLDPWTGPLGHQHDFSAGSFAVEVKATTVREGRIVSISSVDQLDPNPEGTLYLSVHRFERIGASPGITLPSLIAEVEAMGANQGELFRRLNRVGYSAVHDDLYRERVYRLVERRIYDTSESGFPKITRSSFVSAELPAGTLRLRYSIDLTNEPPSPLAEDALADQWKAVLGK